MGLSVRCRGHADPPLILLHGWGFNARVWDDIVARLADQHRCLAVDLPGFGHSPVFDGEYSLRSLARQLADDLPADALWVGWSLGALVAMQVAVDHPAAARALVLVAATPSFRRRPDWPHAVDAGVLEGFGRDLVQRYEQTLERFITLQVRGSETPRPVARVLRHRLRQAPRPTVDVLQAGLKLLHEADLRKTLGLIRCPVNVLLGERDTLVPQEVRKAWHALQPAWQIDVIPGAGHAPFLSHLDLFCDHIAGVSRVSP